MQKNDFCGKVAFQGIKGAFSHQACKSLFPKATPMPFISFKEVFQAVEQGRADYAVLPIENSNGGRVAEIHYILHETSLAMVGEYFANIQQHLLGVRGSSLENIDVVMSHPQAFAQCRNYLQTLAVNMIPHADTAGAAEQVARGGNPNHAAIASDLAADIYDLAVLAENIQNSNDNTTRFIIFAKRDNAPIPPMTRNHDDYITSMIYTVRSVPAALYKTLGGFATCGINLLKLESYIAMDHTQSARFYIEINGHPENKLMQHALHELEMFTSERKSLGVYLADEWRKK